MMSLEELLKNLFAILSKYTPRGTPFIICGKTIDIEYAPGCATWWGKAALIRARCVSFGCRDKLCSDAVCEGWT